MIHRSTIAQGSTPTVPRLLVVDDDPDLLELLRSVLESGFQVQATTDPLEALELLHSQVFDLYLYDVCMEALPGMELLVLTLAASQGAPVLLMTGEPTLERAVEALRAGATDLLLKPLDFERLPTTLRDTMAKARQRPLSLTRIEAIHESLTRAVEAKDPTTSGHGDRVRSVCHMIAEHMGLDTRDQEILDRAAALHDVGKIGVPDAVLTKPGRLTEEEFAMIRLHPEIGARILEPLAELESVRECVLNHHERWDGTGYPAGRRAEEVSIAGRVLVLVEVFDALAHARSYKDAWPRTKIRDYYESMSGRHFDPELTRCFLDLVDHRFEELANPLGAREAGRGRD